MKKFMSREHADIMARYHMGMALGHDIMSSLHHPNTNMVKRPADERTTSLSKSRSRNRNA